MRNPEIVFDVTLLAISECYGKTALLSGLQFRSMSTAHRERRCQLVLTTMVRDR
jgi:hypothetical protein